ncbi:hypothetical protein [Kineococcus rhizosphaerae]|uniref:Uncharacterized protein n=1 Tax=Kineococcus rhizosphaerae TaxID=559628 RepID=A0A2T0R0I5_9ACTN|nr:hypothetical protein [Kineococcus rhizosphaerae]PRY12627.1 hypothetical protein CLV37_110190 [Kineococcus rhizosphaerae]
MSDGPSTWHVSDPTQKVAMKAAKEAWVTAVIPILESTAARYGGYITYGALAERLFEETGYRTTQQLNYWIGDVLGTVQDDTKADGRPPLSSLVVYATGGVGPGYKNHKHDSKELTSETERQQAAAVDRLACYRRYCRDLPLDAAPQMTALWDAKHTRRAQPTPPPAQVCPECRMTLPATGLCDCT